MRLRPPWVTLLVVTLSLIAYVTNQRYGGVLVYDRQHTGEFWRYVSASFVHFNLWHLTTNLMVYAILGALLEIKRSGKSLLLITVITAAVTIVILHFFLKDYAAYAGISSVNYAVVGYLLAEGFRSDTKSSILILALVIAYQIELSLDIFSSMSDGLVPVWPLHLVGLGIGILANLILSKGYGFKQV